MKKMLQDFIVLSLVIVFCSASCPFNFASKSARLAKQRGIFVCNLSATPAEFNWNGHKFKIHEAWLEQIKKADSVFYCFTVEVDSKFPAELGGEAFFRPNDGVYWHHRYPVHCIETPAAQEFLDLYLLDSKSPHAGPARPAEAHVLFSRNDCDYGHSEESQLLPLKKKLTDVSKSLPSIGTIPPEEWERANELVSKIIGSITEPALLADLALWCHAQAQAEEERLFIFIHARDACIYRISTFDTDQARAAIVKVKKNIALDGDVGLVVGQALNKLGMNEQPTRKLAMPRLSPVELRDNLKDLAKTSEKYLPNGTNGGILFDGVVTTRSAPDQFGQYVWMLKPEHIYLGREKLSALVPVTAPTLACNGVVLKIGKRYRIFALDCNFGMEEESGTFWTWKGNVLLLGKGSANGAIRDR